MGTSRPPFVIRFFVGSRDAHLRPPLGEVVWVGRAMGATLSALGPATHRASVHPVRLDSGGPRGRPSRSTKTSLDQPRQNPWFLRRSPEKLKNASFDTVLIWVSSVTDRPQIGF